MRALSPYAVVVFALVASLGCPGGGGKGKAGNGAPPYPTDFTPPPALEDPPAADPSTFGHGYLVEIETRFQDRWQGFLENCRLRLKPSHALNQATLVATVELAVDREGKTHDIRIATSSGNAEFDAVALEVASDTGTLPAPPDELVSDDDRLHLTWRFARDRRQAGAAGAAIDRREWDLARAVPMLLSRGRVREAARRVADAKTEPAQAVTFGDAVAEAAVHVALASDDLATQRFGVRAAAAGKVRKAMPRLRALATNAHDLELRREAIGALGRIGDAEALPLLATVVRGDNGADPGQRRAAAVAMSQLDASDRAWELLAPALETADQRLVVLDVLAHAPSAEAVPALAGLVGRGNKREVRVAAAAALGAAVAVAGHKAVKPLMAGLTERDAAVRAACARALGVAATRGYNGKVAFWSVVKLLKDRDERVRAAAVRAGAALGGAAFAKEMYRVRKETSATVLAAFAEGLAWVPGETAFARLVGLAEADDPTVRRAAILALSARTEPGAKTLLAARVGDADPDIRIAAIRAVDDPDVLRELLGDDDPDVRGVALAALVARLGRPGALADALGTLAAAGSDAQRAIIAGAWLGTR